MIENKLIYAQDKVLSGTAVVLANVIEVAQSDNAALSGNSNENFGDNPHGAFAINVKIKAALGTGAATPVVTLVLSDATTAGGTYAAAATFTFNALDVNQSFKLPTVLRNFTKVTINSTVALTTGTIDCYLGQPIARQKAVA